MACSCGCSPCSCSPRPSVCCTPTTESVEYTFENGNLVGIGFFDNETDNLVQFRGAVSNSAALTITLDAANNVLVFDFDDEALILDIPDATTTQRGILETATNGEALAKAATDKILTPSNLAALGSTTAFAGLVELATNAETIAGISTTLAVTPAGLAAAGATNSTTTFADAVARGGASATFAGQFGVQLDTDQAYVSFGTGAGQWYPIFTLNNTSTLLNGTILNLDGNSLTFNSGSFNLDGTMTNTWQGNTVLNNASFSFTAATTLDYAVDTILKIAGNTLANETFIGVDTGGAVAEILISNFISNYNTTTYGLPTGTLARTTFATYAGQTVSNPPTQAEVQAIDDALVIVSRRLGALVTDLIGNIKPSA